MSADIYTPYINDPEQRMLLQQSMTGELSYTLMNDFLSKYSFQKDLYALAGLVAALLDIDPDIITDIEILNPIEPAELLSEKDCILDIKLELNKRNIINVEIQERYQDFWPERSLTYLCRNFNHLKSGQSYSDIKACIQIGILDFELFKKDDPRYTGDFYSEYKLLHTTRHTEYTGKFSIRVLSLSNIENVSYEEKNKPNNLYSWAKLFKACSWKELIMLAKDNPRMQSFIGTVRQLSAEEKVAEACERRRRYSNDIATYEQELRDRELLIIEKQALIAEKDSALAEKDSALAEANRKIEELSKMLENT